jgi:hypothetical protein
MPSASVEPSSGVRICYIWLVRVERSLIGSQRQNGDLAAADQIVGHATKLGARQPTLTVRCHTNQIGIAFGDSARECVCARTAFHNCRIRHGEL